MASNYLKSKTIGKFREIECTFAHAHAENKTDEMKIMRNDLFYAHIAFEMFVDSNLVHDDVFISFDEYISMALIAYKRNR